MGTELLYTHREHGPNRTWQYCRLNKNDFMCSPLPSLRQATANATAAPRKGSQEALVQTVFVVGRLAESCCPRDRGSLQRDIRTTATFAITPR